MMKSQIIWIILSVIVPLGIFVWLLLENRKRKARQAKNQKSISATPYLRGKGLDLQMSKYFPRNEGEEDWEYVKRIFPEIHKKNPTGAVSILFGRSITELSGVNRQLAGDFLSSDPSPYKIKNFLRGFPSDPAYD